MIKRKINWLVIYGDYGFQLDYADTSFPFITVRGKIYSYETKEEKEFLARMEIEGNKVYLTDFDPIKVKGKWINQIEIEGRDAEMIIKRLKQ